MQQLDWFPYHPDSTRGKSTTLAYSFIIKFRMQIIFTCAVTFPASSHRQLRMAWLLTTFTW